MSILYLIALSLPLSIVCFVFETYPRILNRNFGVDIWTHLLYLKEYHQKKGIPGKITNGFIIPGKYDYPPIFIFLLSKFRFEHVKKYEFIFSPFFDSIHLILIFIFSYFLTESLFVAFITQILYLLTPIVVLENSSATPRSLGYILFTIVYLISFLYSQSQNPFFILGAIMFGSLIFLAHRFTTQGFLFFSIFFSIINKDISYVMIFSCSFLMAMVLSKGFYLEVLKGHIGNLIFWRKNIKYRFFHQIRGSHSKNKTNDFIFRMYNQFLKLPPFVLAITNPWTLFVFYFALFSKTENFLISNLLLLVLLFYFLALLTIWIPGLRFLGEGQRYLELSAFPTALISGILLNSFLSTSYRYPIIVIYCLIGLCAFVTTIVIQRKAIIKDTLRTLTSDLAEMFTYLNGLENKPRLFCIPHQITTNTIYHTKCPVFVNADYKDISKISEAYPYLRIPIKELMEKNRLDYILLNEEYASFRDLKINKYKIIKNFGRYFLIKPIFN